MMKPRLLGGAGLSGQTLIFESGKNKAPRPTERAKKRKVKAKGLVAHVWYYTKCPFSNHL